MKFDVKTSQDLKRVTKNLAAMGDGKVIRRRLTKEIRSEVRPVVNQVKAAYRSNPSQNQPNPAGRGDLRRLLARATVMQVRTGGRNAGVSIKVDGRKMPDRMGRVPYLYEGEGHAGESRARWRHPVFGNSNAWVTQEATPTFYPIVNRAAPRVRRRVNRMADDLASDVAKGKVDPGGR